MDFEQFIVDENIDNVSRSNTEFEINNIVLGGKKGITPWKKLKSCLWELNSRATEVKKLRRRIALEEIEFERINRRLEEIKNEEDRVDSDLDVKELEVELDHTIHEKSLLERQLADILAEADVLMEIYNKVKAEVETLKEKYSENDLEKDNFVQMVITEVDNQLLSNQIGSNINLMGTIKGIVDIEVVNHIMSNIKQMVCESMVDQINLTEVAQKYVAIQKQKQETKKSSIKENTEEIKVVDLSEHIKAPENEE